MLKKKKSDSLRFSERQQDKTGQFENIVVQNKWIITVLRTAVICKVLCNKIYSCKN